MSGAAKWEAGAEGVGREAPSAESQLRDLARQLGDASLRAAEPRGCPDCYATAAPSYGRLRVNIRTALAVGGFGYQVAEHGKDGRVVREYPVGPGADAYETAEREAKAFAFGYNAEYHSRVGLLQTATGNRDWDMKLHWVVRDDGGETVDVACGKTIHSMLAAKTIAEAREAGLLDTWGSYRVCKKCWRSPALKLAIAREVHGA